MHIKDKLAALLSVKSIVTLMLSAVFCGLTWKGAVSGEQFMTVFTTVIAFYFGTQSSKTDSERR